MRKFTTVCVAAVLATSCASSPNSISPQYVSPMMYQGYSCDQISMELQRLSARVSEVTGQQQRASTGDAVAMGVGLVLFWPALFFLANNNDKREELSRLRGEYDALQQAGTMKSCFAPQAAAVSAPAPAPATVEPAPAATTDAAESTPQQ